MHFLQPFIHPSHMQMLHFSHDEDYSSQNKRQKRFNMRMCPFESRMKSVCM